MYYRLTILKDKLNILLDGPLLPSSISAEDVILSLAKHLDAGIPWRLLLLPPDQQVDTLVVHRELHRALMASQVW